MPNLIWQIMISISSGSLPFIRRFVLILSDGYSHNLSPQRPANSTASLYYTACKRFRPVTWPLKACLMAISRQSRSQWHFSEKIFHRKNWKSIVGVFLFSIYRASLWLHTGGPLIVEEGPVFSNWRYHSMRLSSPEKLIADVLTSETAVEPGGSAACSSIDGRIADQRN